MTECRHRPYLHCTGRPFAFSLVIVAVTAAGALQAASDTAGTGRFTPACARQDIRAFATIEERGKAAGASNERLADAVLKYVQARMFCLSGQEDKGLALYDSIIELDVSAGTQEK